MKAASRMGLVLLLAGVTAAAQTATTRQKTARKARASATPVAATQEEVQMLREQLRQQGEMPRQLQQMMQQRDVQFQPAQQQLQQTQQQSEQAQRSAQQTETAVQQTQQSGQNMQSELADLKVNETNALTNIEATDKRVTAVENLNNRWRMTGDVRVRYENFFQDRVPDRHRYRIRVRWGMEGALTEDFLGGFSLATGSNVNGLADLSDPISTNETLGGVFEKKVIALDRGFITYQPRGARWFSATGGKFAFNWIRTPLTFDSDINPEGFSQRLSWELANTGVLKNFTLNGMQLVFNENGGGNDTWAYGGQASGRWQLGKRVSLTTAFTGLNFINADAIAQAARGPAIVSATSTVTCTSTPTFTCPAGSNPFTSTTAVAGLGGRRIYNANAFTNGQVGATGTSAARFASKFTYLDSIVDATIRTSSARFPVRLLAEYLTNPRAIDVPMTGVTGAQPGVDQGQAFWGEISVGQTRDKGDFQLGYGFARVEQDAVISLFVESDMRAPTNVAQHRIFAQYALRPNTTAAFTSWFGRTLNRNLQNAAVVPGAPAGDQEPGLTRMQFDIIYKF